MTSRLAGHFSDDRDKTNASLVLLDNWCIAIVYIVIYVSPLLPQVHENLLSHPHMAIGHMHT